MLMLALSKPLLVNNTNLVIISKQDYQRKFGEFSRIAMQTKFVSSWWVPGKVVQTDPQALLTPSTHHSQDSQHISRC